MGMADATNKALKAFQGGLGALANSLAVLSSPVCEKSMVVVECCFLEEDVVVRGPTPS